MFMSLPKREHVPAAIDWQSGRWSMIEKPGRSAATLARIARGREQHGDRFLVAYYGSARGGRSAQRPLGTITTVDRYALIRGEEMRMLTVEEYRRCMGFPAGYRLPEKKADAVKMIGNAVCPPVAKDIIQAIKEAA